MSKLYHPNVCLFMGASVIPGKVKIVTELMQGDVEKLLKQQTDLSLSARLKMAKDAAQGMAWLHGNTPPVIHRDLKTANLLYDENMRIKVCDFGLSETKPEGKEKYDRQPKGTPLYMAPEVMKGESITVKVDVYSFGIIMWEVLTGQEAFSNFDNFDDFYKAVVIKHHRPPIPDDVTPELRLLLEDCWAPEPTKRPDFTEIVERLETIRAAAALREDELAVERMLDDELAANMWKTHFLGQTSVEWARFAEQLYKVIGLELPNDPYTEPLPLDASDSQLRSATIAQLEAFSRHSDENALRAETEKLRREQETRSVPDGYENAGKPVSGSQDASNTTPVATTNSLAPPIDPELLSASSPLDHTPSALTPDSRKLYCLKALLVHGRSIAENEDFVGIERWGKILECFGPLEKGGALLDRVHDLMAESYFHGFLSATTAEGLLRILCRGTFLVRFSNNRPRSLIISKVSAQRVIKHIVVPRVGEGWKLDGKVFDTFLDLIPSNAGRYYLKYPCPGSQFSWIFEDETATLGGYGQVEQFDD